MNKDLAEINEKINMLLDKPPSMEKYQRLGILFVCKKHIEDMEKTDKSTVTEILDFKMDKIGARSVLLKLEPILSRHIKDLEMIAPTISGEFIKRLKEM